MVSISKISTFKFSNSNRAESKSLDKQIDWQEDSHHVVSRLGAKALKNNAIIAFGEEDEHIRKIVLQVYDYQDNKQYNRAANELSKLQDVYNTNKSKVRRFYRGFINFRSYNPEYNNILVQALKFFEKYGHGDDDRYITPLLSYDDPEVIKHTVKALIEIYYNKYDEDGKTQEFNAAIDEIDDKLDEKKLNDNYNLVDTVVNAQDDLNFARTVYRHRHNVEY